VVQFPEEEPTGQIFSVFSSAELSFGFLFLILPLYIFWPLAFNRLGRRSDKVIKLIQK